MNEQNLKALYQAWRQQALQPDSAPEAVALLGATPPVQEALTDDALLAAARSASFELAHRVTRDLVPNTEALARALAPAAMRPAQGTGRREGRNPMQVLALAAGFMAFALVGTLALRGKVSTAPATPAVVQQAAPIDGDRILDGSFEAAEAIAQNDATPDNTVFRADFDG